MCPCPSPTWVPPWLFLFPQHTSVLWQCGHAPRDYVAHVLRNWHVTWADDLSVAFPQPDSNPKECAVLCDAHQYSFASVTVHSLKLLLCIKTMHPENPERTLSQPYTTVRLACLVPFAALTLSTVSWTPQSQLHSPSNLYACTRLCSISCLNPEGKAFAP